VREVLVAATAAEQPGSGTLGSEEAGSSSAHTRAELTLHPSLLQLIEGLNLGATTAQAVRAASEWCDREGVDGAAELVEVEMEREFVAALRLKNAKQKLLEKRLAALPRSSGAGGGSQLSGKI
jgi:hypothetical protein